MTLSDVAVLSLPIAQIRLDDMCHFWLLIDLPYLLSPRASSSATSIANYMVYFPDHWKLLDESEEVMDSPVMLALQ